MKIETRLRLSFGAILLMVIGVGVTGALAMRQSSAQLSENLRRSFQFTAATERLAALAHEHNVVVSIHAAAGTQPDAGRLERIEQETGAAVAQLATLDPGSAARSQELISSAQKKAKLLLMEAGDEPDLELAREPDDPLGEPPPSAPPKKGKVLPAKAPTPAKAPRRADLAAAARAAPGAEARIATLYAEAEKFLADQHAAGRQRMDQEIERRGRLESARFMLLFGILVVVAAGVTGFVFHTVRRRVLRPMTELAALARRVSSERDLRAAVAVTGDDEIRDLSLAFAELMETLRRITVDLRGATTRLLDSARDLGGATRSQSESVARQAAALEEARRTSDLLRASSRSVSSQVGGVLQGAEKAQAISRAGAGAVSAGLGGVEEVRQQTRQAASQFTSLVAAAQQIGVITGMVKDLADQSHLVALNAALEASRAGVAGTGFAIVAREVRSLADRSIEATRQVRTVLSALLGKIRESAALMEAAQEGLEAGAGSTRLLGSSLEGLSTIIRENLGAAHSISGAVADQGAGIDQITSAVEDLARMMDETLRTVGVTGDAARVLTDVSGQVSEAVQAFRV